MENKKLVLSQNAIKVLVESVEDLINSNNLIDRVYIDDDNYIKIIHYTPSKEIKLKETQKNNYYKNKNNLTK